MKLKDTTDFMSEMEKVMRYHDPNFAWEAITVAEKLMLVADEDGELPTEISFPSFISTGAIYYTILELVGQSPEKFCLSNDKAEKSITF